MTNVAVHTKRVPALRVELTKRAEAIKHRAFELFQRRGHQDGHALDDWLRAEGELLGWPEAEVQETDEAYALSVTLPGFDAQSIEVAASAEEVLIHAAVPAALYAALQEGPHKVRGDARYLEFGANDMFRRFGLAVPIEEDGVTATFNNGVLHIKALKASRGKAMAAGA